MNESLDEAKKRISRKYLGKAGVHAVGIRRSENALAVYVEFLESAPDRDRVIEEISAEAAPYTVIKVEEERARME